MATGKSTENPPLKVALKIEQQRLQLFNAGAIIRVCAVACVADADADDLATALACSADVIDDVAAVLEKLADGRAPQASD